MATKCIARSRKNGSFTSISKMLLCPLPRFFRRHSTADVLFRPQIDVKLPFFRELAMHFVAYTDGGD